MIKKTQQLTCDCAKQGQKSATIGGLHCPFFFFQLFVHGGAGVLLFDDIHVTLPAVFNTEHPGQ